MRQAGQDIGQLALVNFQNSSALAKHGNNYFRSDPASMPPIPGAKPEVYQGQLEARIRSPWSLPSG